MDFDALYTGAGVMDMGHYEHAVSFKQQAIDSKVPNQSRSKLFITIFLSFRRASLAL